MVRVEVGALGARQVKNGANPGGGAWLALQTPGLATVHGLVLR